MRAANVPVVPGSPGAISDVNEAVQIADEIGFPIMLKAAAGGGGKGIRKIYNKEDLPQSFASAQQEANAAFGDDSMYIEKIVYPARHIEIQILADNFGHVIHLGERDCSLQRNNQKVLEESPSVVIDEQKRQEIGMTAVKAAQAVDYCNAGTIEFLMDEDGNFYFMEMNTRIQVEHPITEMVTGIDIVKKQLEIASGRELTIEQEAVQFNGHAIECRINAENPNFNFAPSPGKIENLLLPAGGLGVRVESAMYSGYTIPPYYDSMIAKVIAYADTRFEALMKMQRALSELVTDGVVTNAEFQLDLISHPKVLSGDYNTAFLQEEFLPNWTPED
ncbi:biotin carboxylase [Tetragenococcus muriaticus PMC-11-5]|uniref:biotin carboxylase n=2 Tax=Tetragenococcus muriaticus TaxID=64642 RepID=A0A091C3A1_9ENTE|nr:biotin carboxylase [Tetragenococcus muriaticus PMC-11-5]